jgi:hypothetical protein
LLLIFFDHKSIFLLSDTFKGAQLFQRTGFHQDASTGISLKTFWSTAAISCSLTGIFGCGHHNLKHPSQLNCCMDTNAKSVIWGMGAGRRGMASTGCVSVRTGCSSSCGQWEAYFRLWGSYQVMVSAYCCPTGLCTQKGQCAHSQSVWWSALGKCISSIVWSTTAFFTLGLLTSCIDRSRGSMASGSWHECIDCFDLHNQVCLRLCSYLCQVLLQYYFAKMAFVEVLLP